METKEHIISVFDLENFVRIAKKLNSTEIFELIDSIQKLTIDYLKDVNPRVINNMGDGNLLIFNNEHPNEVIKILFELKNEIELLIQSRGFNNKVSVSSHVGDITIGNFGKEPFLSTNAFGEAINNTFLMNGKPFKGRFSISPQLFRKLDKETRKSYHKYTPQIMYLAE